MEVMIKGNNDKKQASIKAKDKGLNNKIQEFKVKETEVKQLLEFKVESIKVNRVNEAKLKGLEKAIINSNKLKSELEDKSKYEAQQLSELEKVNVRNFSRIHDLEVKQKELITLKDKDKEMVANLNQHVVKIKPC